VGPGLDRQPLNATVITTDLFLLVPSSQSPSPIFNKPLVPKNKNNIPISEEFFCLTQTNGIIEVKKSHPKVI
jgi:hypothetical protein